MVRALLAGGAAMVLALSGAASAIAAEDPTTTVSGVVTAEDTGLPLAGVSVFVNSTDFSSNGAASTNADGTYAVTDLEPGEYTVRFAADFTGTDYVSEYWDGVHNWSSATRITAVGGGEIVDVDASLALGGSISGTVTRADDGAPVAGVTVSFVSDAGGETRSATTDTAGHYRSFGLLPASYTVRFDSPDEALADEYWNGAKDAWSATRVAVVSGQETTGVDASLAEVATITGSVKLADGNPATGVVSVSGPDTAAASVPISADGSYRLLFAPGSVTVYFQSYDPRALSEYWENAGSPETATPVSVSSGQTVVLDAQLDAAGVISGVVRGEDGPLYDAIVEVWKDGEIAGMAYTKSDGSYEVPLPEGTYLIRAQAEGYCPEYFDGAFDVEDARPVDIAQGETAANVDVDLAVECVVSETEPSIALDRSAVEAGGTLVVTGERFYPGEVVEFELHSAPIALGTLIADADGGITGSLTIPASAPVGAHTLVALHEAGGVQASAPLQVTARSGSGGSSSVSGPAGGGSVTALATTGSELPVTALVLGAVFAVLGVALVRRRRVG